MRRCLASVAFGVIVAAVSPAQELRILERPRGGRPEEWRSWKTGADVAAGAAVDNGKIVLLAIPGTDGMILASAADPAVAVELKPVTDRGADAKIAGVKLAQQDETEAALDVTLGGGGTVRVKLGQGALHVEAAGMKGVSALDVCGKIGNTVLPDFFGFDAMFVPRRCRSDKLTVPAENFLLNFLEGGDGIAMCVWQGTLSLGSGEARAGREPKVDLFLSGDGAGRRIDKTRIEFAGKPVFVALLAGKGIWREEDVSGWDAQKPAELAWKPPFEAKWRASFIAKEGMVSADLGSSYLSNDVLYRDDNAKWVGDVPTISMQGLWPYFIYSFWIVKDHAWLGLYADMNERKIVEQRNNSERDAARKEKRAPRAFYPKNVYDKALIYPMDRRRNTPIAVSTPVDVMRNCLGQGPCEYVLDLEGVKGRASGGSRDTQATCGNYENNISHFVEAAGGRDTWFKVNDKRLMGLKPGERFAPEFEARLVTNLEDMVLFVTAVNQRLNEYRTFDTNLIAFCQQAAARSEKVKPTAERVLRLAQGLQGSVSDQRMAGFNKQRDEWDRRVAGMIADVKAGKYDTFHRVGEIRDSYAVQQDIAVSACRRYVKGIRIEVSTMDSSDPDILSFTSAVREMCHQILRNKHGMEGF